jgi:hypothetical protein
MHAQLKEEFVWCGQKYLPLLSHSLSLSLVPTIIEFGGVSETCHQRGAHGRRLQLQVLRPGQKPPSSFSAESYASSKKRGVLVLSRRSGIPHLAMQIKARGNPVQFYEILTPPGDCQDFSRGEGLRVTPPSPVPGGV